MDEQEHVDGDERIESLDAFLTREQQAILAQQGTEWEILDPPHANRVLWRLGRIEAKRQMDAEIVRGEHEARKKWLEMAQAQAERRIAVLTSKLRSFYDRMKDNGFFTAKHKSFSLPDGYLSTREQAPEYERSDETLLLAWAKTQPADQGLWRTVEEPVWGEIRKRLLPAVECDFMVEIADPATGEVTYQRDDTAQKAAAQAGSFAVVDRVTRAVVPGVMAKRLSGEVFVAKARKEGD